MEKLELVKLVDDYCEKMGYEDSPAYALLEGLSSDLVFKMIDDFNKKGGQKND